MASFLWVKIMQDIPQSTLNETTKTEQPARIEMLEGDLTLIGSERYYFCNEANDEPDGDVEALDGRISAINCRDRAGTHQ